MPRGDIIILNEKYSSFGKLNKTINIILNIYYFYIKFEIIL
jgi:hypothetical protein